MIAGKKLVQGIGINDRSGVSKTKEYAAWVAMLNNVTDPTFQTPQKYKGVDIWKEWLTFSNFVAWYDLLEENKLPKGVYFHKRDKKYSAQIRVNGKQKHLGTFSCCEDAIDAIEIAKRQV